MTRDGIIVVCVGALVATPVAIWIHMLLSRREAQGRALGWLAMASFLAAWLAVITFFTTLFMLVAVLVITR
ncbi:MAG: hypothetical protein ACKVVP_01975 [Chloroflexota bacterium]